MREYFIAALEDVWDYAPAGMEDCGAKPALNDTAKGFLVASSSGLGRRHIKAQYVDFTDATFTVRKVRLRPHAGCAANGSYLLAHERLFINPSRSGRVRLVALCVSPSYAVHSGLGAFF